MRKKNTLIFISKLEKADLTEKLVSKQNITIEPSYNTIYRNALKFSFSTESRCIYVIFYPKFTAYVYRKIKYKLD